MKVHSEKQECDFFQSTMTSLCHFIQTCVLKWTLCKLVKDRKAKKPHPNQLDYIKPECFN